MKKEKAQKLLQEFLNTDHQKYWHHPNEIWDQILVELYFKDHEKEKYENGSERGNRQFYLSFYSDDYEDLKGKISAVAEEIEFLSTDRVLETLFISDRMEDGETDYFEWQWDIERTRHLEPV